MLKGRLSPTPFFVNLVKLKLILGYFTEFSVTLFQNECAEEQKKHNCPDPSLLSGLHIVGDVCLSAVSVLYA